MHIVLCLWWSFAVTSPERDDSIVKAAVIMNYTYLEVIA